ncbi:MAG: hypothetical protein IPL27_20370 [Lewinellaceae bacterium]|nr:hypothetical protein [Lewinellaceae bacterium]
MNLKNINLIVTNWFSKPWYPLAISAYPVVALLSANVGQVQNSAGMRSLLISILFGVILYALVWLFLRQAHKAAVLTSLWLALFFSFGHIYIALDAKFPDLSYTNWLGVVWIVLFAAALLWIVRSKSTFAAARPLSIPLRSLCWSWLRDRFCWKASRKASARWVRTMLPLKMI